LLISKHFTNTTLPKIEVNQNEFQHLNRHCWQGRAYYLAPFTVRVIIAPADLKFELWFKNTKYNRSHDPIAIEWDPAGASARPPTPDEKVGYPGDGNWESYGERPVPGRFRSS
jgi:hypothetical protein